MSEILARPSALNDESSDDDGSSSSPEFMRRLARARRVYDTSSDDDLSYSLDQVRQPATSTKRNAYEAGSSSPETSDEEQLIKNQLHLPQATYTVISLQRLNVQRDCRLFMYTRPQTMAIHYHQTK